MVADAGGAGIVGTRHRFQGVGSGIARVSFIGRKLGASFVENVSDDHKRCSSSTTRNVCILIWNQMKLKRAWELHPPGLVTEKAFSEALQGVGSSVSLLCQLPRFARSIAIVLPNDSQNLKRFLIVVSILNRSKNIRKYLP